MDSRTPSIGLSLGLSFALFSTVACGGSVSDNSDAGGAADTAASDSATSKDTFTSSDTISVDSSPVDAGSGACGGKAGLLCPTGSWCSYAIGTCHNPDELGVCRKREALPCAAPRPDGSDAVCGCDGTTYGNQCAATSSGISVDHLGPCVSLPGKICGGLAGGTCASSEYCDWGAIPSACGGDDGTGTCKARPASCIPADGIFCGCDGKTYESPCAAALSGSGVRNNGPCPK